MMAQGLYLTIGLMGIPIFAKGGGIGYIFQPTFGYLLGFFVCAFIIGKLTESIIKITFIKMLLATLAGLGVIYAFGVTYMWLILNFYIGNEISYMVAFKVGMIPFLTTDLIQTVIIAGVATVIIPQLRRLGFSAISNNKIKDETIC